MSTKAWIATGVFFGSTIGSYLPILWGGSAFSFSSIFFGLIGGLVGIWAGWKIGQSFE